MMSVSNQPIKSNLGGDKQSSLKSLVTDSLCGFQQCLPDSERDSVLHAEEFLLKKN